VSTSILKWLECDHRIILQQQSITSQLHFLFIISHTNMEFFAREMQDVVRILFPDDDNKRQRCTPNSMNNKKKKRLKRSSVSISLRTPTPLREVRNIVQMTTTNSLTDNLSVASSFISNKSSAMDTKIRKVNFDASTFQRTFFSALSKYPPNTQYLLIQDVVLSTEEDSMMDDSSSTTGSKEEEMEIPLESLSSDEIGTLRVIMMPPKRQAVMQRMNNLLLGDSMSNGLYSLDQQHHHIVHRPSFWYQVLQRANAFKREYASTVNSSDRFDMMFGFTWCLATNPAWLTQHARGWKGEQMVSSLAIRWKNLLKYDSVQLGILDDEFSFPALICFLDNFKAAVESTETYGEPKMRFDYI
jgi:hypothetical protein